MSAKSYYIPPEPSNSDINYEGQADCKELDATVFACINIACRELESHLKSGYLEGAKYIFSECLQKMKETHEVIRQIYREYAKEEKTHQISAMPLARQQIESLFTVVMLFRQPQLFPVFERVSLANIYKRFIYEARESQNLERFKESNEKRRKLLEEWMLGEGPILQRFTKEELKSIENFVLSGTRMKDMDQWPKPKQIITTLAENSDESLARALLRLYVEYEWLSGYVHSSFWADTSRLSLKYGHPVFSRRDFSEREIRNPPLFRSYIAMLLGVTVASQHISSPTDLRARLTTAWECFEKADFVAMYVWNVFAKRALGILEL